MTQPSTPTRNPAPRAQRLHIVILSGAGISAESGVPTYRGTEGIWRGRNLGQLASPDAWVADPDTVSDFYDNRRVALAGVQPNAGHGAVAALERHAQVTVITQNVDDLHERAGSSRVLHMHGLLTRICSDRNPDLTQDIGYHPAPRHEPAPDGGRWRPAVVWFGEDVHHQEAILRAVARCDELWVVGTSLTVYPAAGLIFEAHQARRICYIDPNPAPLPISDGRLEVIADTAGRALPRLLEDFAESNPQTP